MIGRGADGNPWLFRELAAVLRGEERPLPPTLTERLTQASANHPIGVIFAGMFMSMLDIAGLQLTNLTAYNEYITDVIIAVIVYLAAFSLVIRMWLSGSGKRRHRREEKIIPATQETNNSENIDRPAGDGKEAAEK